MNVSDMTVTDEDGYLSCSKTFNSNNKTVKERIWIVVKLTIRNCVVKVDESNARSRTCSKKFKITYEKCPRSQKREQQQKWLRTSHSCITSWLLVLTQKSHSGQILTFEPQLWCNRSCSASFAATGE